MSLIPVSATRALNRALLHARKQAPHILFGAGIAGFGATVVLSSKATLKLGEKLDDAKHNINEVKELYAGNPEDPNHGKDLAYVYGQAALDLAKLYGPSVIVGVASIAALSGSHIAMTRRNAGLTATVATLSKAMESYRARVREELGEDRERDLYQGVKYIEEEVDGKKVLVAVQDGELSGFARFFDEQSPHWTKHTEYNRLFVLAAQQYANDLLHNRRHIFLNEVYDHLGFERTPEGQVMGWVMTDDPKLGDNFVDFGLHNERSRDFMKGWEPRVLLDFNVNGVVYDLI